MEIVTNFSGRRHFLRVASVLLGSVASITVPGLLSAQQPQVEAIRLSDKALFVQGADSNVLVVDSEAGLVMVDGGHADGYEALISAVSGNFPGKSVRALINTHWHPEVTGANLPLGKSGVEIIAHENTMLWLSTRVWQRWSDTVFPPLPREALPATAMFEDGAVQLGEHKVQYGHMRNAHTDGDIWVYFEDENILVTGGLVSNGKWPVIDWWTGGYIGGMLDGFVSLLDVPNRATRIVPAYGGIMTLDELREQNQMYLTIFDRLHGMLIQSYSLNDVLAERPAAEFEAAMGDSTAFITQAFQSFQGRIRDPQNFRILNIP